MVWKKIYESRLKTPEEAIKLIKDGDRVVTAFGCCEPIGIERALVENYENYHDVQVTSMLLIGETPWVRDEVKGHFSFNSFFASGSSRKAIENGIADFTTCYFYEIPKVLREVVKPRVTIMSVSPPDKNGYVSLGTNVDYIESTLAYCEVKIAQVNKYVPKTHGEAIKHVSEFDCFVEIDEPLPEVSSVENTEVEKAIGKHCASLINDGDCIQLGIGGIPNAICAELHDKKDLGLTATDLVRFDNILRNPHGIILVTGPTGSGKSTTLYTALSELASDEVNIITVEDPVEANVDSVNQVQVNVKADLTFASALRSILRQDPDIIMVGETRDHETAKISVSAAITGHLVLSTLHTNDAVSAVIRMEDMGIEPYLVANSLSGVVAQRLARKVCLHCSEKIPVSEEETALGIRTKTVRKAVGCELCNGTGYKGRVAIHEVVVIDKHIRGMIAEKRTVEEIYQYVEKTQNIRRLKADMIRLVEEGVTTIDELLRLTYRE